MGTQGRGRIAFWLAAYVVASVVGAWMARDLNLPSGFSPWYPPAGLAMGLLLIGGWRYAPVAVGARLLAIGILFPHTFRSDFPSVLTRAVVIVAVYAVAAEVLRGVGMHKAHLRELGWFALVGVTLAPVVASLGVALVAVGIDGATGSEALDAARTFWVGDAVAIASIVPFLLLGHRAVVDGPISDVVPASRGERIEALVQGVALILVPVVALSVGSPRHGAVALTVAVIPAVWVAARRDLVVAAFGVLLVNSTVAIVASWKLGPGTELIDVQTVMLAGALTALYVGAAMRTHADWLAEAREREARYEALVHGSPDLIVRFRRDGTAVFRNRSGDDDVVERLARTWAAPESPVWERREPELREWRLDRGPGGTRWLQTRLVPEGAGDRPPATLVSITTDTTELRTVERQLAEELAYDRITGLASPAAFQEFVAVGAHPALAPDDGGVGIVVVDLDRFRAVRLDIGRTAADGLLREIGGALTRVVPRGSLLARTGDAEFAVAVPLGGPPDGAPPVSEDPHPALRALADRLLDTVRSARLSGGGLPVTASVGLAAGTGAGGRSGVLDDARLAVTAAKELGRDRVVAFTAAHRRDAEDRQATLAALRRALDQREFRVLYQPEVDLRDHRLLGAEALVRWTLPGGELLPPSEFLPLAERSGLLVELGALVLEEAVGQLARWTAEGWGADFTLAVNVSATQLVSDRFVADVRDACDRHGVHPSRLRLELTETSLLADPQAAAHTLAELRALGAQLALDDFGAGYASIGYLRRLPLDVLKIDRSFVSGLPGRTDDLAIVKLVIDLAASLGLEVTAEGIETDDQLAALVELGCPSGQGFLFERPVPPDALASWFGR